MKPHPHLFWPIILFVHFRLYIVYFFCTKFKNSFFFSFSFLQSPLHKCILHAVKLRTMDEHIAVHINASVNEKTERERTDKWSLAAPSHPCHPSIYVSFPPMEKIRDKKTKQ